MKKLYIILLSSLLACTSRGGVGASKSSKSYGLQYYQSLEERATNCVQKNVHQAVKKDCDFLRASNQLTPENVIKNIKNEMALLDLPEHLLAKVLTAYRQSYRWGDRWQKIMLLEHKDPNHVAAFLGHRPAEECTTERVIFCNANSDASQVAVIAESLAWTMGPFGMRMPPQPTGRLLYLWRENPADESKEWSKKVQTQIDPAAEDVVWSPSDDELCVASSNTIMVLARAQPEEDFKILHTIPIARFRDPDFDIGRVRSDGGKMDDVWKSFGRFAWDQDTQELAVETERNVEDKKSRVAIVQLKDGAVHKTQTIEIPISSEWGINAIEWDANGDSLDVSEFDDGQSYKIHVFVRASDEDKAYKHVTQFAFSGSQIRSIARGKHCVARSEDGGTYTLSPSQKDSIHSMYAFDDHHIKIGSRKLITAVRKHSELGIRTVGSLQDGHVYDEYGYLVSGKYLSLKAIAKYLAEEHDDWSIKHERDCYGDDSAL